MPDNGDPGPFRGGPDSLSEEGREEARFASDEPEPFFARLQAIHEAEAVGGPERVPELPQCSSRPEGERTTTSDDERAIDLRRSAVPEGMAADASPDEIENLPADGGSPQFLAFLCDRSASEATAGCLSARSATFRIVPGGIRAAIDHIIGRGPARFLIVDLDESNEPMADIDALADVCEPETSVIAVGSRNDVALYRELLDAGVSEYLVKPLDPATLSRAVERASQKTEVGETPAAGQGHLTVFVGSRGGVGTSTLATNTAWQLASRLRQPVVLVDLDLHFGTAALALDLEPSHALREMMENPARIDSLFIDSAAAKCGDHLRVLATELALDTRLELGADALDLLFAELRRNFQHVIVDLPRDLALRQPNLLMAAGTAALVSDMSLAGMRDTMRLLQYVKGVAPKLRRLVIGNRFGSDRKNDLPRAEFERGIEEKITHLVPHDPKCLKAAQNAGKAIQIQAGGSKLAAAIETVCAAISQVAEDAPGDGTKRTAAGWLGALIRPRPRNGG